MVEVLLEGWHKICCLQSIRIGNVCAKALCGGVETTPLQLPATIGAYSSEDVDADIEVGQHDACTYVGGWTAHALLFGHVQNCSIIK